MRWKRHAASGNVAALIVEPLILGAGGMLIYERRDAARDARASARRTACCSSPTR